MPKAVKDYKYADKTKKLIERAASENALFKAIVPQISDAKDILMESLRRKVLYRIWPTTTPYHHDFRFPEVMAPVYAQMHSRPNGTHDPYMPPGQFQSSAIHAQRHFAVGQQCRRFDNAIAHAYSGDAASRGQLQSSICIPIKNARHDHQPADQYRYVLDNHLMPQNLAVTNSLFSLHHQTHTSIADASSGNSLVPPHIQIVCESSSVPSCSSSKDPLSYDSSSSDTSTMDSTISDCEMTAEELEDIQRLIEDDLNLQEMVAALK